MKNQMKMILIFLVHDPIFVRYITFIVPDVNEVLLSRDQYQCSEDDEPNEDEDEHISEESIDEACK